MKMMADRAFGEFDFIESVCEMFRSMPNNGFEGIGDDCAVLPIGNGEALVFTSDMLNEEIHFLTDKSSAFQIGYKSLMVNISDVAAMGAKPVATMLSLALPKERFGDWSAEFMRGYKKASKKYGVKLIGGDTVGSKSGVCISVTAIGRAPMANIKRRSAAKVGDVIVVTGRLGASAAGLRDVLAGKLSTRNAKIHLAPEAQVCEGEWLGKQDAVHAMADISDGISSDLQHILDRSKKGAIISMDGVPVARGASFQDAIFGGEDYQLLFTVDRREAESLMQSFEQQFGKPLYKIGRVVRPNYDCYYIGWEDSNGRVVYALDGGGGYNHFGDND
ncbi:MAG: thiamine-phosphate kinase [Alistipes sp.]|nr:thiamine-phosphate kinase [Alistipes sp.]